VIAETKKPGQGRRRAVIVSYEECAVPDIKAGYQAGAPQLHPKPRHIVYDWHIGDQAAPNDRPSAGPQRGDARAHQQPPGAERDGAARGDPAI